MLFPYPKETLKFTLNGDTLRGIFQSYYYFDLPLSSLPSPVQVKNSVLHIEADNQNSASHYLQIIINTGFQNLISTLNKKKTIFVHKHSGIPLIGSNAFGIVDRNTSIIEVKLMTGCNIYCVYCSVDQTKREINFLVDKDYLIEQLTKVLEYKNYSTIEIHLATQGEPFFYEEMVPLLKGISSIPCVKEISVDTNGTMLTEKKIDALAAAGMTRINLSLNSLNEEKAKQIAGTPAYHLEPVKKIAHYIPKKMELIIAPVWMPGVNDQDIDDLVAFYLNIKKDFPEGRVRMGIQNYLFYKQGSNPIKPASWEDFTTFLKTLEEKHHTKLLLDFKNDFSIQETKPLPKPFKKGDVITATVVCEGRFQKEYLAAYQKDGWNVSITFNAETDIVGKTIQLEITGTKHNIYFGKKK